MVTTKLGCPYPRCPSGDEPAFKSVAGAISECCGCGRLVVACTSKSCEGLGTFNRPFVRHCRRHKDEDADEYEYGDGENRTIDQAPAWEQARREGWNLVPRAIANPEVVADLSELAATDGPVRLAMIGGALAVHQAGSFLALLKVVPGARGGPFLWDYLSGRNRYPFPATAEGSHPVPYPPRLLPGDRHLMYACPQGVLVLDLWSCHGLSARYNDPRTRLIRCRRRSLAAAPIPLGESQVGLLTRNRTGEPQIRWAVWDFSKESNDREFESRLDAPEPRDAVALPLTGKSGRADLVDDRVIAFTTPREQWVWKKADALNSNLTGLTKTWPGPATKPEESIILDLADQHLEDLASVGPARHAFLLHRRGAERFSWFLCVRRADPSHPEPIMRYEVDFETLEPTFPQPIRLRTGAIPIGSAPDTDHINQMYFRAGTEIWKGTDGLGASHYQDCLPQIPVGVQLCGPLVLSVGDIDQGQRSIRIDSLHHRGPHVDVFVQNRLLSEPLLWYHWLFTIELDAQNRLQVFRRTVTFENPRARS